MNTHIALLRAVNVGGTGKIAMAALREFAVTLGFRDVRTLLQSGNLVFTSSEKPAELEHLLEREAEKRLSLKTVFFVRSAKEWNSLIAQNPFPDEAARDPAYLHVMPLKNAPTAASMKALEAAIVGPERVRAIGNALYAVYPNGAGESRLTNKLIESKLETRCTARNWNTATKLAALAGS